MVSLPFEAVARPGDSKSFFGFSAFPTLAFHLDFRGNPLQKLPWFLMGDLSNIQDID